MATPEQIEGWLKAMDARIVESAELAEKLRADRNAQEGAATTHHGVHLRTEAEDVRASAAKNVEGQEAFREELSEASPQTTLVPGAFAEITINGVPEQILFMNNRGNLPDVTVITPQSPIGRAVAGRRAPQTAAYRAGDRTFNVKINKVQ